MNLHKQGITFVFLLLIFTSCSQKQSLQWIPFSWEGDTISGIYIEKAFFNVPVKIEGSPYEFTMQFDLGAYNSIFYGNTFTPYLEELPSLISKRDSTGMYKNVHLQIGTVEFSNVNIGFKQNFGNEIPKDSLHSNTPKHIGTIASDIVQDKILIIDYKSSRLAITDFLPIEYKNLPAEKFESKDWEVTFPLQIDGKTCKVLFDTGSSPFQLITTQERAWSISDLSITDSLSGPLWWGQEITFYGFNVNKPIKFGGKALNNSKVYYAKDGLWDSIYSSFDVQRERSSCY